MRFLIVGDRSGSYNHHLHYDFFERELRALKHDVYRWRGGKGSGSFVDAVSSFSPDVVISHSPKALGRDWLELPDKVRKVAVQCDYHYITTADPCLRASDMVFFRASEHVSLARDTHGLTEPLLRWLPFSVDTNVVPRDIEKNYERVFFAGNAMPSVYPMRHSVLRQCPTLVHKPSRILTYKEYLATANRFGFGLACKSTYNLDPAKMLEYASVGCIPLCDSSPAQDILLPGLSIHYTGPEDVRQIVSRANHTRLKEMSAECRQFVKKHHSHAVRAKQFLEEVCSLF